MKLFLKIFIFVLLCTFFPGTVLLAILQALLQEYFFAANLLFALALSALLYALIRQHERFRALEKRLQALEERSEH